MLREKDALCCLHGRLAVSFWVPADRCWIPSLCSSHAMDSPLVFLHCLLLHLLPVYDAIDPPAVDASLNPMRESIIRQLQGNDGLTPSDGCMVCRSKSGRGLLGERFLFSFLPPPLWKLTLPTTDNHISLTNRKQCEEADREDFFVENA